MTAPRGRGYERAGGSGDSPARNLRPLLTAAIEGRWRLVSSPLLVAELDTVLARAKFRRWLSIEDAHTFVGDVRVLADLVADPPASPVAVTADPKDEFVVALAKVANVVALVSGDPHLTELVDLDPPVLTPAAFLNMLDHGITQAH